MLSLFSNKVVRKSQNLIEEKSANINNFILTENHLDFSFNAPCSIAFIISLKNSKNLTFSFFFQKFDPSLILRPNRYTFRYFFAILATFYKINVGFYFIIIWLFLATQSDNAAFLRRVRRSDSARRKLRDSRNFSNVSRHFTAFVSRTNLFRRRLQLILVSL